MTTGARDTLISAATDDETLMQRYAAGDSAAFELLYRRHKDSLYRYFIRQCPDRTLAEDLYQDVWNKVIRAAASYRPTARFTTWLYHLAHHRMVDHFRTLKALSDQDIEQLTAHRDRPEQQLEQQHQAQQLRHCLEKLPALQLDVFMLKQEAGLTAGAIASIVGASEEATKSRLRYASDRLRDCLANTWREVRHGQ